MIEFPNTPLTDKEIHARFAAEDMSKAVKVECGRHEWLTWPDCGECHGEGGEQCYECDGEGTSDLGSRTRYGPKCDTCSGTGSLRCGPCSRRELKNNQALQAAAWPVAV